MDSMDVANVMDDRFEGNYRLPIIEMTIEIRA